jgi:hypothetical protein
VLRAQGRLEVEIRFHTKLADGRRVMRRVQFTVVAR